MKNKNILNRIKAFFKLKSFSKKDKEIEAINKSYVFINDMNNFYSIDDLLIDLKISINSPKVKWVVNKIINSLMKNYQKGSEIIYKDLVFTFKLGSKIRYPILSNQQMPNLNSIDLKKVINNDEELSIYNELYKQIKNKLKMNCAVKLYDGLILQPSPQGQTKILFLF